MVKQCGLELLDDLMKQVRQTNYSHKRLEVINHHLKSHLCIRWVLSPRKTNKNAKRNIFLSLVFHL